MAALAIDDYTDTPDELLERAQQAVGRARRVTNEECAKIPALLMKAVNNRLAELAPDEEPRAAVKRLAAEREDLEFQYNYQYLIDYCERSMSEPPERGPLYELIYHEDFVWYAEEFLKELKDGNA